MKYGTGLQYFKHDHPDRFFDVGMAEQHAVTFAAGLASQGLLPTVAIYSTFFQRAYDQMIHDVCLMRLNVLFAVDRAGLVPNDGETHQGIYDPAFFSEMRVETYSPANYAELEYWLTRLVRHPNGPRAIRYPRGEEKPSLAALGCSGEQFDFIDRQEGADTVLVSYGAEAEEAWPPATCCCKGASGPTAASWCASCRCRRAFAKPWPGTKPSCLPRSACGTAASVSSSVLLCSKAVGGGLSCCTRWTTATCCTPTSPNCAKTRRWTPPRWPTAC